MYLVLLATSGNKILQKKLV